MSQLGHLVRQLGEKAGRAVLSSGPSRLPLLLASYAVGIRDRAVRRTPPRLTPRPKPGQCPACESRALRQFGEMPYLSTHIEKWGAGLVAFMQTVPAEFWLTSFAIDLCDDCGLQFVPLTDLELVEAVEKNPVYVSRTIQPWLETAHALMTDERVRYITETPVEALDTIPAYQRTMLEAVSDHLPHGARYLDLGCNTGAFAELVRRQRADATVEGCEINPAFVEMARQRYPRIPIRTTVLGEGDPTRWDMISLTSVIEHIWDLDRFVGALKQHLNERGRLLVATPNVDCAGAKQQGLHWSCYIPPHHCQLFGPRSLDALFTRQGFGRLASGEQGDDLWAVYEYKQAANS